MANLYIDARPGARVFLATTAYDSPDSAYTFAIARGREALSAAGIVSTYCLLSGNCHVDDARNTVVAEFLATDCEALVFIDADVSWAPAALVRLCNIDKPIVGGIYPYRDAERGQTGEMPGRFIPGPVEPDDLGLVEVEGLPTGFMKIRRDVLETLAAERPSFDKKGQTIPLLFERVLEHGTRWGGDLNFCNLWRARGGKVYADYEMVLGHTAKTVMRGSMASGLRRKTHTTLAHVAWHISQGTEQLTHYREAREYCANPWGAEEDVLAIAVALARRADGPILEAGSGLTTILMAAATEHTVYALEHDPLYAEVLRHYSRLSGVGNIGLCLCPIADGWYDLSGKTLPERFALGLNDGPPRTLGDRRRFFLNVQADTVVCDDADDAIYCDWLRRYAEKNGKHLEVVEQRTAIISGEKLAAEAA